MLSACEEVVSLAPPSASINDPGHSCRAMKNPEPAYGCEPCRSLQFPMTKPSETPKCRMCQQPMTQIELTDVVHQARLIYLGAWAAVTAIGCGIGLPLLSQNPESFIGKAFLILGGFGALLIASYVGLAFLRTALGLGGWRWLTKKTVPKEPPAWHHVPTLGQALARESFVSLGIVILFTLLTLIRGLLKG